MIKKKKILVISPHLSTGGAPQVTLNKIQLINDEYEIKCVEYAFVAWSFVVQRNQIQDLLGDNFHSLGDDKHELIKILNDFNPDIISMEEFPEFFMDDSITKELYKENRSYTIFETTHDSSFPVSSKRWFPNKFIFVSAYNAFRYSIYDIPYDIVEYPVDYKEKDKKQNQELLDLDPTYKHVLNVGLFTARKNQSYIFDIAHKLKDYKIKFHFLGNQADNFKSYWEPLINNKPDNCVVWGERKDVQSFIEASDLFLFPSKGDRNNKELNPIALKEALEYKIPMMMYNLDVYCGKYDKYENITFLTGDINIDTSNLLSILNPYKEKYDNNELVIVGTYPNTKSREKLTIECIESVRKLGRKIMLVSHYPVSDEIQKMVDYYIFDSNNPTTEHSYYTKFYNYKSDFDVEININGLKDTNQSLPVLTNLINGFKSAKDFNFNKVFYITYDVILHPDDIEYVNKSFEFLDEKDAFLCTLPTDFNQGIETTAMTFKTNFFLDKFSHITTKEIYKSECEINNCQNFLEDFFYKKLINEPTVSIITNDSHTFLTNSGKGVSSNSEYYSILPIMNNQNKWVFYFYTYNVDDRTVNIEINKNSETIYSKSFNILKSREFLKEIKFDGTPIEIKLSFFEDGIQYKTESYILNNETVNTYKNNGWFKYKRLPKIKLVHLQTTNNDEREILSRESLQQVSKHGIEYVLHTNELFKSLPPSHNCVRPQCVSMELFDEETTNQLGTALTPAHYGCFESFKNGIISEFDKDLDFLIVCEGDCIIETPIEEFINKVKESCNTIIESDIQYFSFGDTKTLDFAWPQSNVIKEIPNQDLLFITDKIIGLQCIMFPRKTREFLHQQLRNHKWDCADTYFNLIFAEYGLNMGILKNRITTQADGVSLIDKEHKIFIK
jgi:hypothetical protein